jgi:Kyakuja-Dileera-Zisupton transposase
LCYNWL